MSSLIPWDKIEQHYKKDCYNLMRDFFCIDRMNPREIGKKILQETGIKIGENRIKEKIVDNGLAKKIGTYYVWDVQKTKLYDILNYYKLDGVVDIVEKFYFKKKMSLGAWESKIKKDTGIQITRQALLKWVYISNLMTRSYRQAYNLALYKGRLQHKRDIASQINYRDRNVNYSEVQTKRMRTFRNYDSKRAYGFGLKNVLIKNRKYAKDLARHLMISEACVKRWCACTNRINGKYWDAIFAYLTSDEQSIFKVKPSKEQIERIKQMTPTNYICE